MKILAVDESSDSKKHGRLIGSSAKITYLCLQRTEDMKICIVCGARPNFIKVAPLLRAVRSAQEAGEPVEARLVYTGAADDPTVERSLFDDLQIAPPDVCLGVTCSNLNELTGRVMSAFERYLQRQPADVVVVVDDLASTMAVAIVTKKQGLCLAHLVAGTRSFDINMPKEINRLVIDGLSDLLFTAGISNTSITNKEGAEQSKVYFVGNLLIDNLRFNRNRQSRPGVMDEMNLSEGGYILFTLNRKALIGNKDGLLRMLAAIDENAGDMPVLTALREPARAAVRAALASLPVRAAWKELPAEAMAYHVFGYLAAHAGGLITDSGNVAEEATFNQVPCITLNSYTEHIETVTVGTNVLVGEDPGQLGEEVKHMVGGQWKTGALPDRWDGRSAERILQILQEHQLKN